MSIPRNSSQSKFAIESKYLPKGDQEKAITSICQGINDNHKSQNLIGATGTGKTYVMAKIIEQTQRPALVLAHNKTLAAQLYKEFKDFFPNNAVEYFVSYYDYYQPEAYVAKKDLYIEKDASINDEIDKLRLRATASLINRHDVIIVSSVSCIYGLGSAKDYHAMYLTVSVGERLERDAFLMSLIEIQYSRNDHALERSQFRVVGDVIDIIPSYMETAYRIELWGDEVEKIFEIDPLNNTVITEYDSINIFPAKHFVTKQDKIDKALRHIKKELKERIVFFNEQNAELEKHRIDSRTRYDLEMLSTVGYCAGIENYSRHLTSRKEGEPPDTLLDYFPEDFMVFVDESHVTLPQVRGMFNGDRARKLSLVEHGFRLPSALDNRPLQFPEFVSKIKQMIFVSATPGDYEIEQSQNSVEMINRPTGLIDPPIEVRSSRGQIDDLLAEIKKTITQKYKVLITTLTKKMAEKLSDYLQESNIKAVYIHSDIDTIERVEILMSLRRGDVDVIVGINLLREGLDIPEVALVAILDADKVGFLRSQTSLIQTVGRAARNKDSKVIMYADRISKAMQGCIDETNRRRDIQMEYNKKYKIEPASIIKKIDNILPQAESKKEISNLAQGKNASSFSPSDVNKMKKKELQTKIKEIELLMRMAADQHDFEKAIFYRENLKLLKQKIS